MRRVLWVLVFGLSPAALAAQAWNDPATLALIARAAARRAGALAEGLRDFEARAHGFVFFLGQLGEGLEAPPKLIKADQLAVEVYWQAPGRSKQRIVGWRDRMDLPADIQYHRDHLGIVMNGFGDRIRLGDGDEVRDVPHPLAPGAAQWYDFALSDSLTLGLPERQVRVYEVAVRPKDPAAARLVGLLYLDAAQGDLVRMRFQFTRAAYRDPSLEDITVLLDNGLWEGRYWLPRQQEIEIRRHTTWLDFPARGIIRARWEIGDYRFNVGVDPGLFTGPEIAAAPAAVRAAYPWSEPLDAAVTRSAGQDVLDAGAVRSAVSSLVSSRMLSGAPAAGLGAGSLSELVHVNRVEGLALGMGMVLRPSGGALEVRLFGSFGTSDRRFKARLAVRRRASWGDLALEAGREVRDVADQPLIAPVLNSLAAQELGRDYGDYVLREGVSLRLGRPGRRWAWAAALGAERSQSVGVRASPVTGSYRVNPPLGAGGYRLLQVSLERPARALPQAFETTARLDLEGGLSDSSRYLRLAGRGGVEAAAGGTRFRALAWAGWASPEIRRDRALLWGGRGAAGCAGGLRCAGRYGAGGDLEWRISVPVPDLPLGAFVSSGRAAIVAPFLRAAWLEGTVPGSPWSGTNGVRPLAGLGLEWPRQLLRVEVGFDVRTGRRAVTVDLNRSLWPLL